MTCSIILFLTLISFVTSAPMSYEQGMKYLENFGYSRNKSSNEMSEEERKQAVEEFQKYFNISMTGLLDNETLKMMQKPRCKMPDIVEFEYTGRWNYSHITYKFINFPRNNYNATTALDLITKAMNLWVNTIDLTIQPIEEDEEPLINIQFVETADFEDPNGIVIAFAQPPADGDMFYLDENWESITEEKLDLHQIAAHEFGHAIGLNHIDDKTAVMHPIFEYKEEFKLQPIDLLYAQTLYGKKYSLCEDGNIDAILNIASDTKYIFRRTQCWKFSSEYLQPGYPKLLHEEWLGLSSSINAAFIYNNYIYFVQGRDVLKYNGNEVQKFEVLDKIYDATVTIEERLYAFKDFQYWRYDVNQNGMSMVRISYPRNISSLWKGVPAGIDAAYYEDEIVYFFKGTQYFQFDISRAKLMASTGKPISQWEGCNH